MPRELLEDQQVHARCQDDLVPLTKEAKSRAKGKHARCAHGMPSLQSSSTVRGKSGHATTHKTIVITAIESIQWAWTHVDTTAEQTCYANRRGSPSSPDHGVTPSPRGKTYSGRKEATIAAPHCPSSPRLLSSRGSALPSGSSPYQVLTHRFARNIIDHGVGRLPQNVKSMLAPTCQLLVTTEKLWEASSMHAADWWALGVRDASHIATALTTRQLLTWSIKSEQSWLSKRSRRLPLGEATSHR